MFTMSDSEYEKYRERQKRKAEKLQESLEPDNNNSETKKSQ